MAKGNKGLSINISPDEVMYSSMSKSKEGYHHAGISAKRGEGEYVSVSYEWKGDTIPDFAMDLMGFMQSNKTEIAAAIEAHKEDAAKKKENPFAKKGEDDEMDDEKKDKKGGDKKKDKKKDKKEDKKKK